MAQLPAASRKGNHQQSTKANLRNNKAFTKNPDKKVSWKAPNELENVYPMLSYKKWNFKQYGKLCQNLSFFGDDPQDLV